MEKRGRKVGNKFSMKRLPDDKIDPLSFLFKNVMGFFNEDLIPMKKRCCLHCFSFVFLKYCWLI